MHELYSEFRRKLKLKALYELSDVKSRLSDCSDTRQLEVFFRQIEQWANKQKKIAQRAQALNDRGSTRQEKLKIIIDQL